MFFVFFCQGQRSYAPSSVLATGNWYLIGITGPGVYKVDVSFLNQLGIPLAGLSAGTIRLFGNGGAMIPEAAGAPRTDDLQEVALWVEDGGDGNLNGADYFLFYAEGPDRWLPDSATGGFRHVKNIYSDTAFYFLTWGGTGKRIARQLVAPVPNIKVNRFDTRYFHELDSVNLLSSGQQWFGEEFSALPGKSLSRNFPVNLQGTNPGQARLRLHMVARSVGNPAAVVVRLGNQKIMEGSFAATGSGPYDLFAQSLTRETLFEPSVPAFPLGLDFTPGSYGSQAWLDWFEVQARANLDMQGNIQLQFRDWQSVGPGIVAGYTITGATDNTQVWDVTTPADPLRMLVTVTAGTAGFSQESPRLREYVAFHPGTLLRPFASGRVANQNLHALPPSAYLIVTVPPLLPQARRLAEFHQKQHGLDAVVVTANQVFNEFSSGIADPVAIRDFVKMYYDRAGNDSARRPRYLLLFGDASFDYKNRIRNNTSYVPAYESPESLDPLSTYTSDDFFGFLDDADDINGPVVPLLDIGIGRIPARTEAEATAFTDKVLSYHSSSTLGPWRNVLTFVADDEDANLHLDDAEFLTRAVADSARPFSVSKIYLDAYRQQSGPGGSLYPEATQASDNAINNGTLIWNYSGHGGFRRLAAEVVVDQGRIDQWTNAGKLPLFITATCDVAPFDNPLVASIGENLLLRPKTGAIALMTTTRLVFAFSNRIINKNYLDVALRPNPDGSYLALGDAVRKAKNLTYTFFGDPVNNRKFTLLGDPALTLAFPRYRVRTTQINGKELGAVPDTLRALSAYTLSGEVTDFSGNRLRDFQGTVLAEVLEKPVLRNTLGNDPASPVTTFSEQQSRIFRGKAKVEQGLFQFSFVVPRDIDYRYGPGRLRYYAENGITDANGGAATVIIGGTGTGITDSEGPVLKAWLNDERFTDGSITNATPILLIKLRDSSGINILGGGIGHDLTARIDDDPGKVFQLNAYYEADPDSYRSGRVQFQLPAIEEGLHTLRIKAWDVMNNASEILLTFRVARAGSLTLEHVLNYPNPFTTNTHFWFDHNRPGEPLEVTIQLFTLTGKLVKTLRNTIISDGNRSSEIQWDGRDDYGERLGRGTYIYTLSVKTADGKTARQWQKLYIL